VVGEARKKESFVVGGRCLVFIRARVADATSHQQAWPREGARGLGVNLLDCGSCGLQFWLEWVWVVVLVGSAGMARDGHRTFQR
jgi:hypothetical protein